MKTSQCLCLLVAGLFVGLCVSNATGPNADAQGIPNAVPAQRFQISAWGMGYPQPPGNTPGSGIGRGERGCYIVDTVTGELWHAAADGPPKKISEKLR